MRGPQDVPQSQSNGQLTFVIIALIESCSVTDGCELVELIRLLPLAEVLRAAGMKQMLKNDFVLLLGPLTSSSTLHKPAQQPFREQSEKAENTTNYMKTGELHETSFGSANNTDHNGS